MPVTGNILFFHAEGYPGSKIFEGLKGSLPGKITGFIHSEEKSERGIDLIYSDIYDLYVLDDLLLDFDIVILGSNFISAEFGSDKNQIRKECEITANIVNACQRSGVKQLVYIGAVDALGIRKSSEMITEQNIFSHSKYDTPVATGAFLCEQEVWRIHAEGLPVVVLNTSTILSSDSDDIPLNKILFTELIKDSSYSENATIPCVDFKDIVTAAITCLEGNFNGERFIISADNIIYSQLTAVLETNADLFVQNLNKDPFAFLKQWIQRLFYSLGFKNRMRQLSAPEKANLKVRYDNTKSVGQLGLIYTPVMITIQQIAVQLNKNCKNQK